MRPCYIFGIFQLVHSTNILLKKPSIQSSDLWSSRGSQSGNNGHLGWTASTKNQVNSPPYWQGDLLGFYHIHNISVTNAHITDHGFGQGMNDVFIGVSVYDVRCVQSHVVVCGQWPSTSDVSTTLTFTCPLKTGVRFVRLWKEPKGQLALDEVDVQGTPISPHVIKFERQLFPKSSETTNTMTSASVQDCVRLCKDNQPCVSCSYKQQEHDNCLLADTLGAPDVNSTSFTVRSCP